MCSIDIYGFLLAINYRLSIYKRRFRIIKNTIANPLLPFVWLPLTRAKKNPFLCNGVIRGVRNDMLWHWTSQKNNHTNKKAKKCHELPTDLSSTMRGSFLCSSQLCSYWGQNGLQQIRVHKTRKILFNFCVAEHSFNEICYLVSRLGGITRHQTNNHFNSTCCPWKMPNKQQQQK